MSAAPGKQRLDVRPPNARWRLAGLALAVLLGVLASAFIGGLALVSVSGTTPEAIVRIKDSIGERGGGIASFLTALLNAENENSDSSGIESDDEEQLLARGSGAESTFVVAQSRWPMRVAVYVGRGASNRSSMNVVSILASCASDAIIKVTEVEVFNDRNASQVRRLTRNAFDVVLFPGGIAGVQHANAWKNRRAISPTVRTFLRNGGGFVGICAGAYLSSWLKISSFTILGGMLGVGTLGPLDMPDDVRDSLPLQMTTGPWRRTQRLLYANGPIYLRAKKQIPGGLKHTKRALVTLDESSGTLTRLSSPQNNTVDVKKRLGGVTVVTSVGYGAGTVVSSSGHPETEVVSSTSDPEALQLRTSICGSANAELLINMVLIAGNRTRADVKARLKKN